MLRPFGSAKDSQARYKRKIVNVFNATSVHPEPVEGLSVYNNFRSWFESHHER